MFVKVLGKAFVAAMCGFAVLVVCAMLVRGYIGGPARPFAGAVMQVPTAGLARILTGPTVWVQQRL